MTHTVTVVPDGERFNAKCSCGWELEAKYARYKTEAEFWGDMHVKAEREKEKENG